MQDQAHPTDTPVRIFGIISVAAHVLNLEADLLTRFLGDDLNEICESAADSRFAVLISTAGHDLDKRREAVRVWRMAKVEQALKESPAAKEFMDEASPEVVTSFREGLESLANFKLAIETHIVRKREKEIAARRGIKSVLRARVRESIRDIEPKHAEAVEPRWMVVTPTGEVSFWRYERRAKEFGRSTGEAFFVFAFDPKRSQLKAPRSGWPTANFHSESLDADLDNKPSLGMSSEEMEDALDPKASNTAAATEDDADE